jgi:hypothetical protein
MTTAAEILVHALALPPGERAGLARTLLSSLPDEPCVYHTESELCAELNDRLQRLETREMETFDADATLRRAREALERSRR